MAHRIFISFLLCLSVLSTNAQVVEHEQHSFPELIPAGGYSGITWLGDSVFAVVSDNVSRDGFFLFSIHFDETGDIVSARNMGFKEGDGKGRDSEGVAWCSPRGTLFVSGERDNKVLELNVNGTPTGNELRLPKVFENASQAYGLEALTYNAVTHRFWTTSESTLKGDGEKATATNGVQNRLRLQAFNDSLLPVAQYWYVMDEPVVEEDMLPQHFAMGVSALTALDDGRLLVLEREFAVPEAKLGAFVNCKIYEVAPNEEESIASPDTPASSTPLTKKLVAEWLTAIGLLDFSIANYEGMCLGPKLPDGGQVLVLISDSQNQYAGILADWLKTIVIY